MERVVDDFHRFLYDDEIPAESSRTTFNPIVPEYESIYAGDYVGRENSTKQEARWWGETYEFASSGEDGRPCHMFAAPIGVPNWTISRPRFNYCPCCAHLSWSTPYEDAHLFSEMGGKKRVIWTTYMEAIFRDAVTYLGQDATPKPIREYLIAHGVCHVTRVQVASHLQKYKDRAKRKATKARHLVIGHNKCYD